jgi:hypothetical protein
MTGEKWAGECQAPGTKTSDGRAMVDLILCWSGLTMEVSKLNRIFHCLIGGSTFAACIKLGNESGFELQEAVAKLPPERLARDMAFSFIVLSTDRL